MADKEALSPTSQAHTPGPWHIDRLSNCSPICIKPVPGTVVCDIGGTDAESEANAQLIAAAPELLEMAESARNAFEERLSCLHEQRLEDFADVKDLDDQIGNYEWLRDKCEAMIAKAKGKAA